MQCPPYWVAVEVRRTHRLAPLTRPDDARERGVGTFQPPDEPANGSRSRCRTWRVYVALRQSNGGPMCQSLQTWLGAAGQRGQDGGRPQAFPLFTMAKPALRIATLFRTGRRIGLSCFSYSGWQGKMVTDRGFTTLFSARARRFAGARGLFVGQTRARTPAPGRESHHGTPQQRRLYPEHRRPRSRDLPVRREGRRLREPPHDQALAELRRHDLRARRQARVRRPHDLSLIHISEP